MAAIHPSEEVRARARVWLGDEFDPETRSQVEKLLQENGAELTEAFYRNLEFGTGGLRGIMGAGTNRMNIHTVGMATQGLCNYLKKQFPEEEIRVAIAYDSRHNSRLFAERAAGIFSGNRMKVFLFDSLRPTPELSYAIRKLKCHSGLVITASHNPKEYNGYKAYWQDGGQVVPPHDKNIISEVNKITSVSQIQYDGEMQWVESIGAEIDQKYLAEIKSLSLAPKLIRKHQDLKIVYTPIHGTGGKLVPEALQAFGFTSVFGVEQQQEPDGDFPSVKSPNPEEAAALELALQKAREVQADLVMATDPDADRVGIAVQNKQGEFILLNGNQMAALLTYYLLHQWKEKGKLKGKEYIMKTIVTSELLSRMADRYEVECVNVLTGFKYIAEYIRKNEKEKTYIGGGEESYGYLVGDSVRDKDAVSACAMLAETAAWAKEQGLTMYELLIQISQEYGLFREQLVNLVRKGKTGAEEIQNMMENFRNSPPQSLNGKNVVLIHDFLKGRSVDLISDLRYDINLPSSNVLQFILEDDTVISVRPSGTEPKIKFYFSVRTQLPSAADFEEQYQLLGQQIDQLVQELGIPS